MTRRTNQLKWVGATVVTAIAIVAPAAAEAGSGAGSPATVAQRAAGGDHAQDHSEATGRGGLDRHDAAVALAILGGVLLLGLCGYVVVCAVIAAVAAVAAAGAKLVTGKPRRRGWADWPGTPVSRDTKRKTPEPRSLVRPRTELR